MTFYWSTIVNIALSGTVFQLYDVEWYHDLEIWVRGHWRSFKPVPFESFSAVSCSPSVVTIAIKRDTSRKSWFFHTHLHSTPPLGGPRRNIAVPFGIVKLEWWGYPMVKNFWGYIICNRLDAIPACDGQTSCDGIVHATIYNVWLCCIPTWSTYCNRLW